jgi:RNA polymerase sigma-70 factor (ECF subfamily)
MTRADFNDLVRQTNRNLYGHAYRILRSQEEAEDIVQEVFIKMWNMGTKLDGYTNTAALAVTMTRNLCIDQIRKKKHFREEGIDDNFIKNSDDASPFELIDNRESEKIVSDIIDKLPDIYKSVIVLREFEDMSYDEIAEKTRQNINTLRVTLSRARKMIRDEFNKYQYERRGIKESDPKIL